ncbi:MAG: LamG domain-containing protein [Acidobacteriota bacterium]
MGETVVADRASGFDGVPFPAPLGLGGPNPQPGPEEGSYHFDGVSQFVMVPHDDELDFSRWDPANPDAADFSIDAWIHWDATDRHDAPIVSKRDGSQGYYFYLHDGLLSLILEDGMGTDDLISNVAIPAGQWVHVTVTVDRDDSSGVVFYVDGVAVATEDPTGRLGYLNNGERLFIGATPLGAHVPDWWYFNGGIDEVEIFDRVLTPTEVHAIYELGKCKNDECVEPPSMLEGWWPLDETVGPISEDIASSHDGVQGGGPIPMPGQVAGSLRFDGFDDVVKVPDDPGLDFGLDTDLTIDLWVRTFNSVGLAPLVTKVHRPIGPGAPTGYSLFLVGGYLSFFLHEDPSFAVGGFGAGPNLADGQWHFVAVTVDRDLAGVGGQLFVDGVLIDTFDPTTLLGSPDNDEPLLLGAEPTSLGTLVHFAGQLDEVEIFRRALDPSELEALYLAGPAGKCK